jgi:hypothetical protein
MAEGDTPPPGTTDRPTGRSLKGFVVELVTITVGVLIALSFEGLRQWGSDRALVRQAQETIAREIAENRDEVGGVLETAAARDSALADALRFANELLADGRTSVTDLELGFTLAELSAASWESAERTGALGHMEYATVREYSRLYEAQALFSEQQHQSLQELSAVTSALSSGEDPATAPQADLESFRERVLDLRGGLQMQQQLARRLVALYDSVLTR